MKKLVIFASFVSSMVALPLASMASTPPEAVDRIDTAREGNLQQLVKRFFQKNAAVACDVNQTMKIDILKLSSSSANDEKTVATPYEYSANYLVLEKCLYGSTFVGAYSDAFKSVIMTGSFKAHYKDISKFTPAAMTDLTIKVVREITDTNIPSNP